ncbi:hypothetical protein GCK72_003368 [Caenorhabditis remanei]|uniref:Uncharacterized protein n=1 Tax=Caenorhabditis remanei TaxID=31234 RepID=A0A6A5HWA1_CAERE|nr:hypothetical protein GCK72_003368 [Caenorhabditis remanei]KAF1771541.1 hypothetical protein GCK72_003368 [Caenorhabditis remanei]
MIQEGPEAVRSLSSRSRSGPSETPTSRKHRNAGNTCADSASGKKVYHLQAPNFQQTEQEISLGELKSREKKGQLLRDIDKGKVEELTLLPYITLVYSHETSSQPVFFVNAQTSRITYYCLDGFQWNNSAGGHQYIHKNESRLSSSFGVLLCKFLLNEKYGIPKETVDRLKETVDNLSEKTREAQVRLSEVDSN